MRNGLKPKIYPQNLSKGHLIIEVILEVIIFFLGAFENKNKLKCLENPLCIIRSH
jgi:hypothetical protein